MRVYVKPKMEIILFNNSDNNMLYLASGNYNTGNLIRNGSVNTINLHS